MAHRLLAFLLLLAAVFSLGGVAAAASDVSVTVRAANEGRLRGGGWVTVLADLSNQGRDADLELAVTPLNGSMQNQAEYVVPVQLPAGGKKRVPISVPISGNNQLRVVVRAGDSILYDEKLTLSMVMPNQMLVGVLSDDELGIPALSRLGQDGANSAANAGSAPQVVRLDASTFPAHGTLLQDFDLIALSHFDSSNLAKEQVAALESWVAQGGTLLLAGGPEWKRTFAGLPDSLLPVAVTGVGQADLSPLGALVEKPLDGGATGPVSLGQVRSGRVEAAAGDIPLLVQSQVGVGKVVYLAADPGLEPLARWQGQPALFTRYLWSLPPFDKSQMDRTGWVMGALQRIPGLGLPSLFLVFLLLLGYILLAGPVSYWVLKRLDRREWAWLVVPALAVLFVVSIYGAGFGRRTTVMSHLITATGLTPGSDAAVVDSYVGIFAPTLNKLTVNLQNANLVQALQTYAGPSQDSSLSRIVSGERTTLEFTGLNNYSMKGFAMEQEARVTGGLQLVDATMDSSGVLQARLLNRLDRELKDIRVTMGGTTNSLGSLAPGAQSDRFLINFSATGPKGPGVGLMNAIPYGPPDPATDAKRQLLGAVFGPQALPGNRITVTAWTDQPLVPPSLPEIGRLHQGVNLVWANFPVPASTAAGDLPPGVVEGVPEEMNNVGRSPMGYSVGPGNHVFRLLLPQLDPTKVADVKLHISPFGPAQFGLSAKEQKSGDWVPLTTEAIQSLPNWQRFVSSGGLLEIRIEMGNSGMEFAPPTVSVKGVGN